MNTASGYVSLQYNTAGYMNTAFGSESLVANTTGNRNTAIGKDVLYYNTTGNNNAGLGFQAMLNTNGADNNTAVGYQSLYNNVTGTMNTALGAGANVTATNLTNATAIGSGALVNASNKVRIGNGAVTIIEGAVPFTSPSDGRFKFNIQEDVKGLEFIMKLRPVTYQFDMKRLDGITTSSKDYVEAAYKEATAIRRTGFIAQEVEKAAQESHYNFSGLNRPASESDHYSLSYESFVVPLVKSMQEQQKIIEEQHKDIQDHKKINESQQKIIGEQAAKQVELEKKLEDLQKLVHSLKDNNKN
jgi:hypothetical protein